MPGKVCPRSAADSGLLLASYTFEEVYFRIDGRFDLHKGQRIAPLGYQVNLSASHPVVALKYQVSSLDQPILSSFFSGKTKNGISNGSANQRPRSWRLGALQCRAIP